jgi:competence protein ComFC
MVRDLRNQFVEPLAALAFPTTCQICNDQQAEPSNGYVCAQCLRDVRPIKPPWCNQCGLPFDGSFTETSTCLNCHETKWHFDCARSLFTARGLVRNVIHRFKYNHAHYFQSLVDIWLKSVSRFADTSHDWVIPVPLHPLKEREREFNQAEHMANTISSLLKTPLNTNTVERIKYTETQTHLSRTKRLRNMQGAFAIKRNYKIQGAILLVDDVMTTGATVSACAHILKQGGARTVNVLTLARGFSD